MERADRGVVQAVAGPLEAHRQARPLPPGSGSLAQHCPQQKRGLRIRDTLYGVSERGGVCVIVLPTTALTEAQLVKVMKYRPAQYLAAISSIRG
jgi:hypothetical protein